MRESKREIEKEREWCVLERKKTMKEREYEKEKRMSKWEEEKIIKVIYERLNERER